MSVKKVIRENVGEYQLEWSVSSTRGLFDVKVWKGSTLVMEWSYPRLKGCGGLLGHVSFWRDQAILQARAEEAELGK